MEIKVEITIQAYALIIEIITFNDYLILQPAFMIYGE